MLTSALWPYSKVAATSYVRNERFNSRSVFFDSLQFLCDWISYGTMLFLFSFFSSLFFFLVVVDQDVVVVVVVVVAFYCGSYSREITDSFLDLDLVRK